MAFVDAVAARRASQQTAEDADILEAVIRLQLDAAALAGDRTALLRFVAQGAAALLGGDGALISVPVGDDQLRLEHATACGSLASAGGRTISVDDGLAGHAFCTREAVYCADTERDERADAVGARAFGVRSALAAPVLGGSSPLGVILVVAGRPDAFSDAAARVLRLIANGLASALLRASVEAHIRELLGAAEAATASMAMNERRFRMAFERSPVGMAVIDLTGPDAGGTRRRVNSALAAITGRSVEEIEQGADGFLVDVEDRAEILALTDRVRRGELDTAQRTMRLTHADGHLVETRLQLSLIRDDAGRPATLLTHVEDVTADRATARALRERADLVELVEDAVVLRDLSGAVQLFNPAAERIYGWDEHALLGLDLDLVLATDYPPGLDRKAIVQQVIRDGRWSGELQRRRGDGRTVTVLSRKALQRDEEGRPVGVLTLDTDITEWRQAERRLAESEALFRAQFEHGAVAQVILRLDGRVQSANPAFARLLGRDLEQIIGRDLSELGLTTVTSSRGWAEVFAGVSRDGTVDVGHVDPDGVEREFRWTVSGVLDDRGHPVRLIGVVQDVTEARAADRARDDMLAAVRERSAQLEQMEQLRRDMLRVLGHELRTPLAVIATATDLARDDWASTAGQAEHEYLDLVHRNSEHLDRLIADALHRFVSLDGRTLPSEAANP